MGYRCLLNARRWKIKRHIAFKLRIGDILSGKPNFEGERFTNLELDGRTIVRANVIGNVVEKFESSGEKQYTFVTIDDGSGQIALKLFGDDVEKFKNVTQGQTILVIGLLRHFNNEIYVSPEIIKEQDPKYLLLRKMEVEKARPISDAVSKEQIVAVKDKILGAIKNAEEGIEVEKLITDLRDVSPEIIKQEIQKFLEEGIAFEPRPGIVRYLG